MMKYLFAKASNQEHDRKIFIAYSGAMSHMLNSEENITNLKIVKTQVTARDSRNTYWDKTW